MPAVMLSPHFALSEYTTSQTAAREGIDNRPTPEHMENLKRHAQIMEHVRAILGSKPILISSGYRSAALNAAVGGSSSSAHCYGLAADFECPAFGTPHEIVERLRSEVVFLGIDQLIDEYPPDGWVHLGLSQGPPRHQVAVIDAQGFRLT